MADRNIEIWQTRCELYHSKFIPGNLWNQTWSRLSHLLIGFDNVNDVPAEKAIKDEVYSTDVLRHMGDWVVD